MGWHIERYENMKTEHDKFRWSGKVCRALGQ